MIKTELESKLELSPADFQILQRSGRIHSRAEQLNLYYDCANRLSDAASTFRVRLSSGKPPTITLKLPKKREGAKRESLEIEQEIGCPGGEYTPVRARRLRVSSDLPQPFVRALTELGIDALERVGWMRNTRWVVYLTDRAAIELDRTFLPDGSVLYEAEIESDDLFIHEHLVQHICGIARSAQPSQMSKFERFISALNRMREASGDPSRDEAGNHRPNPSRNQNPELGAAR